VQTAFDRGAEAAVVSTAIAASKPTLVVPDTVAALQKLGRWARRQWAKPVVAVTGSAGKTSTKDTIAELLSERFRVGKTDGNFNNHLGLPLSLVRIPDSAEIGVMELGMNQAGEIRFLASLAEPQVGVVTNVGYAHIESFNSIEDVGLAKRELIEALPADGCAVLNADDERVLGFQSVYSGRVITYGLSEAAELRAQHASFGPEGVDFMVRGVPFRSSLLGRHGILNILAGLAVAGLYGIGLEELRERVSRLVPGKWRGERIEWNGIVILNDCYNSNPDAVRLMIDVLREERAKRRIAVLGEMLELGSWTEGLHREVGAYAAESRLDAVIGVGGAARFVSEAARDRGLPASSSPFFAEPEEAGQFLKSFARSGDAILFKGSRGTHVERALAAMES
jgi:UDP-N-acetylmuramoyl-tripeptide--D-alanyl-D-alanine ligase